MDQSAAWHSPSPPAPPGTQHFVPGGEDPMDRDRSPSCLPTAATTPMLGGTSTAGIPWLSTQGEPPHHSRPLKEEILHYDTSNNFHENSSLKKLLHNQTQSTRQSAAAAMGATSTKQRVPARFPCPVAAACLAPSPRGCVVCRVAGGLAAPCTSRQ